MERWAREIGSREKQCPSMDLTWTRRAKGKSTPEPRLEKRSGDGHDTTARPSMIQPRNPSVATAHTPVPSSLMLISHALLLHREKGGLANDKKEEPGCSIRRMFVQVSMPLTTIRNPGSWAPSPTAHRLPAALSFLFFCSSGPFRFAIVFFYEYSLSHLCHSLTSNGVDT